MAIAVKSTTVTKTMALMKVFEMMMTVIVVPIIIIIIIIVGRRDEYTKHPKQTQKRSGEPPQENPNPQGGGGGGTAEPGSYHSMLYTYMIALLTFSTSFVRDDRSCYSSVVSPSCAAESRNQLFLGSGLVSLQ